jgi:glucokinase
MASGTALGALGREWAAAGAAPSVLQRVGSVDAITGTAVGEAALAGFDDAVAVLAEYARHVAIGLVGLVNVFDPERVVVSGGLIDLDEVLLRPLREAFDGRIEGAAHRPPVPIVPAELRDHAGVVGAAVLARDLR